MKFSQLVKGRFLYRDNLFRARIALGGREYWAHVPNSGRLEKLLVKDRPIYLIPTPDHTRKTSYAISLVDLGDTLVSIDARLPNHLFMEHLRNKQPEIFSGYEIQSEVTYENHRFDFRLNNGKDIFWIETKSVTFMEDNTAKFPDAVSKRAQNHLRTLIELIARGQRTAMIFIIQRDDVEMFSPNTNIDPVFSDLLAKAVENNVFVQAFKCQVELGAITISKEIPVSFQ